MLVPEAVKLKKKRWALVYPNYEYGQSAVATFKELLKAAQPDVEFVAEQAPPLGKIDAGSVVQALADAKPDAIFNVLFGADLSKFVREGNTRGLFQGREVVSLLTGEPEYLDPLKDETPNGWIVTGYPWYGIQTPEHKAFLAAYQAKYNDYPRLGSVVGYSAIKSLAAGIKKAGGTDTEKLVAAFEGLQVETPFGKIIYRAAGPPVDDGRVRRQDQERRRQGRDGRLPLPRRRELPADRRRGEEAARRPTDAGGVCEPARPHCCTRMTFSGFVVQLLNGLAGASSLFLVGAGLSLIFGVTRIVNFAHGSFYMLGIYIAYSLVERLGGGAWFWPALLLAALAVGVIGALVEMLLLRRIYHAPELFQLLATFALVLVIKDAALWIWGPEDLLGPRAPGLAGAVD